MGSRLETKLTAYLWEHHRKTLKPGSIRRTHAGRHQKAMGAWTWFAKLVGKPEMEIGSQYTLSYLIRIAPALTLDHSEWGSVTIDPAFIPKTGGSRE